jgi:adenosylmethionine-8-amino-7-oxononanoate aminotransferase
MINPNFYVPTFFEVYGSEIVRMKDNLIYFKDGRTLRDYTGGLTSHSIWPWGDPELINTITEKLHKFPHCDYKSFFDEDRDKLAGLLLNSIPKELGGKDYKVFYPGLSGSDAVESAIKLSYQYHCCRGEPQRTKILSFSESYHGSTLGSLCIGDRPNLSIYSNLFPNNIYKLPEVNHIRYRESELVHKNNSIAALKKLLEECDPETVCCVVGESISGGLTGYVPKPKAYWLEVQNLVKNYGVHLILDEVICGTGTSGTFYCAEQDCIVPDQVVLGKTLAGGYLPLNAIVARSEIFETISGSDNARIQQSNTFQGHSTAVVAAVYVQERIMQPSFLENVMQKGERVRSLLSVKLADLGIKFQLAGRGLRLSIQLAANNDAFCRKVAKDLEDKNSLIVDGKWHRIALSPQLTVDIGELEDCCDQLVVAFKSNLGLIDMPSENKGVTDLQRRY